EHCHVRRETGSRSAVLKFRARGVHPARRILVSRSLTIIVFYKEKSVNMVYCTVCLNNNRTKKNISFFNYPKDSTRRQEWLKAVGREDLLSKLADEKTRQQYRVCEVHFEPSCFKYSKNKNVKYLFDTALPTLNLPSNPGTSSSSSQCEKIIYVQERQNIQFTPIAQISSNLKIPLRKRDILRDQKQTCERKSVHTTLLLSADDTDDAPVEHQDIICNNCSNTIIGFRYKCVTCVDYDLCPKCEMSETHAQHYMLRIPRPTKFKIVDDLTKKWKDFFKAEHIRPDCRETTDYSSCDSSDDEPITKYSKQYDSGVDLSEDVKETLRKEVARVLKIKDFSKTKKAREKTLLKRSAGGTATHPIKKQKADPLPVTDKIASTDSSAGPAVPEVAFADVNQLGDQVDVKYEVPMSSGNIEDFVQPMMHVKLSDDLTELMIEMTQNGQRTVYKYSD
ncbi:unnamed protein product, partial [Chilo suppressalis]